MEKIIFETILEEFDEKIDNYYINRLSMHAARSYMHFVVDKTELKSFLQAKIIEALESVVPEAKEEVIPKGVEISLNHQDDVTLISKDSNFRGYNACRKEILSNIEKFK